MRQIKSERIDEKQEKKKKKKKRTSVDGDFHRSDEVALVVDIAHELEDPVGGQQLPGAPEAAQDCVVTSQV